jgi:integrase
MIRWTFGHRDSLGTPKTKHSRRDLDVSPQLAALLHRHRKAQAEAKLAGRLAELQFIFTEPAGGPLDRRTFERAFARVLAKAELGAQHSPKSLRHTYASLMLSEGANQMGHASVGITERVYTRSLPQAVPAVHQLDDAAEASGNKTPGFGNNAAS